MAENQQLVPFARPRLKAFGSERGTPLDNGRRAAEHWLVARGNLRAAMALAGMPREASVIWNTLPWYIGTADKLGQTMAKNWNEAQPALQQLVPLHPALHVVVLMGRKAERGRVDAG